MEIVKWFMVGSGLGAWALILWLSMEGRSHKIGFSDIDKCNWEDCDLHEVRPGKYQCSCEDSTHD